MVVGGLQPGGVLTCHRAAEGDACLFTLIAFVVQAIVIANNDDLQHQAVFIDLSKMRHD